MKNTIFIYIAILTFTSCQKQYEFNADFSVPTELSAPFSLQLDVSASEPVVLTWMGGEAVDGGIVLYEVLFDKIGGDFSDPLARIKSDQGALPRLSLTHANINTIARKAGIFPQETGKLIWTVLSSKGGVVKTTDEIGAIEVTRGEGIDNIPTSLFLYGSATENNGLGGIQFRKVEEGIFQIYTTFSAGDLMFKSGTSSDAFVYYIDESSKLREGNSTLKVNESKEVVRLTVNFNTMAMTVDQVGASIRCIWGASYGEIAVLNYTGGGSFVGSGSIMFLDPSRPETNPPGWLGWIEERYYFIATVNGTEVCWGRHDSVSAERPVGAEPATFYSLYEFPWSQWEHLWKMKGSLNNTKATITINTNADGLMLHTFTNIVPL